MVMGFESLILLRFMRREYSPQFELLWSEVLKFFRKALDYFVIEVAL